MPYKILTADIGGTNARFSVATSNTAGHLDFGPVFRMPTAAKGINSFADFWAEFSRSAPDSMGRVAEFDAVSLALAGAVRGQTAVLPNIAWNIDANDTRDFGSIYLLNDFLALAWACLDSGLVSAMPIMRYNSAEPDSASHGGIAFVGAGTGLGHCALLPDPGRRGSPWFVASSESGHGSFSFQGESERTIERKLCEWTGKSWLSNDDVVSGGGAVLLHRALTGEQVSAAKALSPDNARTVEQFSRFYARACRNYCLSVLPIKTMIVGGGIAAKNPHLLESDAFYAEFNDAYDYSQILRSIEIRLNTSDDLGLRGAAAYALSRRGTGGDH